MHATFRSSLSTTAVAVLAAGAVATAPVMDSAAPSVSSAPVALTALDGPIGELALTVGLIANDLFNGNDIFGDYEWEPYQGLLPEFIFTALPIITQLGYNGSSYLGEAVGALSNAVFFLDNGLVNLPSAIITAAGQAIGGDISGALTTLYNATVVPVQDAVFEVIGAGSNIVSSVVNNAISVISTIPGIAVGLVSAVVGGAGALVTAVVNIATQTVAALASGDLETAWNTVVDGLFGPVGEDGTFESSIPGVIESITIGPGLGPLGFPDGYAVPSLRMSGEQSQLQIANALGASFPVPSPMGAASVRAGKSAGTASPAAATAAAEAGDAAADETDAPAAVDTAATVDTPAAEDRPAAEAGNSRSGASLDNRGDARKAGARGR